MRLLNVRLGPEDARMADELRKGGIQISGVVRDAIRTAHARHATAATPRSRPREVMARIYRECPDPPGPRAARDLRDRRGIRRSIRRRLRRRPA
jgi:hypothetical protein